jgi:hypothetical protein
MQNKESLQHKFNNFGAQPSDALWDSIASNLNNKRKKKFILFWWISSGVFAAFILVLGLSIYFKGPNTKPDLTSINDTEKQNISNPKLDVEKRNETVQTKLEDLKEENTVMNEIKVSGNIKSVPDTKQNVTLIKAVKPNKAQAQKRLVVTTSNTVSKHVIKPSETITESFNLVGTNEKQDLLCEACYTTIDFRKINQITSILNQSLGLRKLTKFKKTRPIEYSFNTVTFFNLKKEQQYTMPNQISITDVTFSSNELALSNSSQLITSIPLVLRFGIATPLSNRFKIQTGVDLGWINSKPLDSENLFQKSSTFTVGIPLVLKFNFVNRRRFDINAIIGAVNDFTFLKQDKPYEKSTITLTKGFLGGAEVGFNFDYKLNEKVKLGIGTGVRTYYYQSKPVLNFTTSKNAFYSLNFGIIWNY